MYNAFELRKGQQYDRTIHLHWGGMTHIPSSPELWRRMMFSMDESVLAAFVDRDSVSSISLPSALLLEPAVAVSLLSFFKELLLALERCMKLLDGLRLEVLDCIPHLGNRVRP